MNQLIKEFTKDKLQVKAYINEKAMGESAADFVTQQLNSALQERGKANLILATGTSQFAFLEALKSKNIDWKNINVFHLDEYRGMSDQHPASFRKYLNDRVLNYIKPGNVYLINGDAKNLDEAILRYEELLYDHPIDVACIGIGENGHIAFNDPPVADFSDPQLVKIVELDEACRKQQLGEGWFPSLEDVPKEAVTLTITAIMRCRKICCVVPGARKSTAVSNTLYGPVDTSCPASILREHPYTDLFLDSESDMAIKE
jgi:glucosamine-6-phosphate deaminase